MCCRTWKSQCCKQSPWRTKAACQRIFFCLEEASLFVLFKPSTDWMRPTHSMEGNLLYSKSTDLNVNIFQKYIHRNTQNSVWPNIWVPHSSTKLTCKISYHCVICYGWPVSSCRNSFPSGFSHTQFSGFIATHCLFFSVSFAGFSFATFFSLQFCSFMVLVSSCFFSI